MPLRRFKIKKKPELKPNKRALITRLRRGYAALKTKEKEKLKAIRPEVGVEIPLTYPVPVPPSPPPEKPKLPEGVEIAAELKPRGKPVMFEEREPLRGLNIYYPLIPRYPKEGEFVYAYANLRWDPKTNSVNYYLIEPTITAADNELISRIKTELEERLDIDVGKLGAVRAKEILREEIHKSLATLAPALEESKKRAIVYYVERDTIGLGKIHALMADPNVEDISCDGVGIPIYVYHRDPRFGSIKTNVRFDTSEELNSFVIRLAQKCKKTISIAEPLLDGALPDGSRVQATLGTDIARKGSNFTIRRFTEKPLTPTHMLRFKTLNSTQLAYLWLAVENGQSILVSGGTATGKTALLNALSLFIRPSMKVVSIEDTPELRLALPHWIPHVARTPLAMKGRVGEVTLFDLLKSSLRQRPDYLVLGEVRGKEAFVLFQQIATGHPALATIHAASIPQLIDRLITPPISLPPNLLENIDIVVFLTLSRLKGVYVRRADAILEVTGVEKSIPITNKVFEWKPITDTFEIVGRSVVLKKIARKSGVTDEVVKEELFRRKLVLEWMLEQGIMDYKDVAKVISAYYSNPERIMDLVTGT